MGQVGHGCPFRSLCAWDRVIAIGCSRGLA
jgi:hypothetical protein